MNKPPGSSVMPRPLRAARAGALATLAVLAGLAAHAADAAPATDAAAAAGTPLVVADAYIELHTGPGRGYPVFHVAARGEPVTLLLSRTGWIRLRTAGGIEGWVPGAQLQATLAAAGQGPLPAADAAPGRGDIGVALGRFAGEPMLALRGAWRFAEALGVEAAAGQVQGLFAGTDFWQFGAIAEPLGAIDGPFGLRGLTPAFTLGVGRFANLPNASLVAAEPTRANLAHAGLALRWRFGERIALRADWTLYTAFLGDRRSREYRAATLGVAIGF